MIPLAEDIAMTHEDLVGMLSLAFTIAVSIAGFTWRLGRKLQSLSDGLEHFTSVNHSDHEDIIANQKSAAAQVSNHASRIATLEERTKDGCE